jgi:hypothetical protein
MAAPGEIAYIYICIPPIEMICRIVSLLKRSVYFNIIF